MNDNKILVAIVTPSIDIKNKILEALRLAGYAPNPVIYATNVYIADELFSLANARGDQLAVLFLDSVVCNAADLIVVENTSDMCKNTVVVALSPAGTVQYMLRSGAWSKTMSLFGITPENMKRVLQK